METAFLNWLVADLVIFGFHGQNWMLAVILFVLFYLCVATFVRRRHEGRPD